MTYLEGIDVSNAQGTGITWPTVAANGISFAYVKATEGTNYVDQRFVSNCAGAIATGLPVGAYHFLKVRPGKPQDAVEQADGFCDAYIANGCTLLPMLDCEGGGNAGATPAEWHEAITMWLAHAKDRLGCPVIIYTYPSFWMSQGTTLTGDTGFADNMLWIAHYTRAPQPIVPQPWENWTLWQYAADAGVIGKVPGVSGNVDRSHLQVDLSQITRGAVQPQPSDPTAQDSSVSDAT